MKIDDIKLFCKEDVIGDKCRRGADNRKWNLYIAKVQDRNTHDINLNDEGVDVMWLSPQQALDKELVYPVRYFLEKYGNSLFL